MAGMLRSRGRGELLGPPLLLGVTTGPTLLLKRGVEGVQMGGPYCRISQKDLGLGPMTYRVPGIPREGSSRWLSVRMCNSECVGICMCTL